jgi:branched-chain amino acid transport system ATP-binding protein
MTEPLLVVEGIEVRYGGVPAVRRLTLEVDAGEVVGLVGPNGAGKSTTLWAIMGVERPSAGDIRFDGGSLVGAPPDVVARAGVALVPEGRHVFPEFTVEENMRLGLLGRASNEEAQADMDWVSSLFPIVSDLSRRMAGQLSGGQQQQLAIARALVGAPRLLLLDEPSLGLAPSVVDTLFDALAEIRDRGVAILLVEQRAQLTVAFADRTHVLRNGELVLTLTSDDAADTSRMTEAYFGG